MSRGVFVAGRGNPPESEFEFILDESSGFVRVMHNGKAVRCIPTSNVASWEPLVEAGAPAKTTSLNPTPKKAAAVKKAPVKKGRGLNGEDGGG